MKIEIQKSTNSNDSECQDMIIDGKSRLHVYPLDDCPEDAIIGRDLVSCVDVANYMKEAYEAGRRGENFVIEVVDEK